MLTRSICSLIALATTSLVTAQERDPNGKVPLEVFWKNGLRVESEDGSFALRVRMRLENDWVFFDSGSALDAAVGGLEDGTELRRMRLGVQGTIYENIDIKAQVDFASGDSEFRSVYANISDVPVVGNLRIGNQREPFGLERNTGTHYVTMMERASAAGLTPNRNTGFLIHDHREERCTWALGFFRETNDQGFGQGDDGIAATGRVTGIPWSKDDSHFVHLGLAASRREFGRNGARFRARPGQHLAPSFVDTKSIAADHGELVGLEALWMHGPTSVQAEHFEARVGGVAMGHARRFQGSYVQVAHFLTGEHRRFKRSFPSFVRVRPRSADGAWEVAGRFSRVDLDDGMTRGGKLRDYAVGLNYHANANVRVMANLVYAELDGVGDALMFGVRFGIDF